MNVRQFASLGCRYAVTCMVMYSGVALAQTAIRHEVSGRVRYAYPIEAPAAVSDEVSGEWGSRPAPAVLPKPSQTTNSTKLHNTPNQSSSSSTPLIASTLSRAGNPPAATHEWSSQEKAAVIETRVSPSTPNAQYFTAEQRAAELKRQLTRAAQQSKAWNEP